MIYLDHAATTPMRSEAILALTGALARAGNPASIHSVGQSARAGLEAAREDIARTLGCDPVETVLTSGGTEAINLALKGLFWSRNAGAPRPVIIAPLGEHHASIDALEWLEGHEGARIVWLGLDAEGLIDPAELEARLEEHAGSVALVTALWVNNEVGAIQPVRRLAAACARAGVPLHLDAVAGYGHVPIDFAGLRAESGSTGEAGLLALSVSAHKIGGPVSSGALVLARAAVLEPLLHGGGQQRQVRSGTQDAPGAAAFAAAARAASEELPAEAERLGVLRDRLLEGLLAAIPGAEVNGPPPGPLRVAGNAHLTFPGAQGDSLLFLLDMAGFAVSTGSACQAGIPEPSHVLLAMGRPESTARSVLRFTLGRTSTAEDVEALIRALPAAYASAARAGHSDRAVD